MAVKLNELNGILVRCWLARTNVLFKSKPALGKTETVEAFIARMQKKVEGFRGWKFYVPSMSPMDIQASCPDQERGVLALYSNELLPNAYRDADVKGVLFLDEVLNGDPATNKLLQKYINREDMGNLKLPEGVIVVGASNSLEHKSGVQQQGRAFMSRMEQHDVYSDATDNMAFAEKRSWHPHVQLFFKNNPQLTDNYDEVFQTKSAAASANQPEDRARRDLMSEEGKNGIWANMRSWERISRKEYAAEEVDSPLTLAEAVANLGTGVGTAYDAHKASLRSLASFDQIMQAPKKIAIPGPMDEQYALAMIVALRCRADQMPQVRAFGERLPLELQAVILRNLAVRENFNLASADSYVDWMTNPALSSLLNGR